MTGFSTSKEDLVRSLTAYTSHLNARNEALSRLWATTSEIQSVLSNPETPDIDEALNRRGMEMAQCSHLLRVDGEGELKAAAQGAIGADGELGELARSVSSLQADSQALADKILACQEECETLLKSRLEATSKAIRQSNQRRKLDAAYGPAISHDTPVFMDRQR